MDLLKNINSASLPETLKALGKLGGNDIIVLEFSEELITGNTISGTINDEAVQNTPFNTDHNTTIVLFKENLENHPDIKEVQLQGPDTLRVRIIGEEGVTLVIDSAFVITGGASQATITNNEDADITGLVDYPVQIVKDVMAIGGTKQVLIGPSAANIQTL